jgi:Cu-Zn family superoxide dismutase
MNRLQTEAIAVFDTKKIKGTVRFIQPPTTAPVVSVQVELQGLKKNGVHGFHIHEYGDMSDQCTSMCSHFNPTNSNHGGPHSKIRHVGDLGNLRADKDGKVKITFTDPLIKLTGTKCNIIGRGLIIHEDEDDLGMGGDEQSLKTGNAGKRIACAVIGHAKPEAKCK